MTNTKGPWKVIHTQTRKLQWNVGTDILAPVQAMIVEGFNNRDGNAEANARLIAAAPELLKVCKLILKDCEDIEWAETNNPDGFDAMADSLRTVIAKAEG